MSTAHGISATLMSVFLGITAHGATIIHVDAGLPNGVNNGSGWSTAYNNLQSALTAAAGINGAVEIRMAQGIYRPSNPAGRTATFQLLNNVTIKGGYLGAVDPVNGNNRDVSKYATVLNGDLAQNDGANFTNTSDNAYVVVTGSLVGPSAVLDGVTVSGASSQGGSPPASAGLYANQGNPTITSCTFQANQSGGAYLQSSFSTVASCTFTQNGSRGLYLTAGTPVITACTFSGNPTGISGDTSTTPNITGCTFKSNQTGLNGSVGTVKNCKFADSSLHGISYAGVNVLGCTFERNGTGIYNGSSWSSQTQSVQDSEFVANGVGIQNNKTVTNCLFKSNTQSAAIGGTISRCTFRHNELSSPTGVVQNASISDCTFDSNIGGAVSGGTVQHCTFTNNSSTGSGGAINSATSVSDCMFQGNLAVQGGAVAGCAAVKNCSFLGNRATTAGGAIWLGGRLTNLLIVGNHSDADGGGFAGSNASTFINCVFSGNTAGNRGGAVYINTPQTSFVMTNCTLRGNSAGSAGGIYNNNASYRGAPFLMNCVLWGNTDSSSNSIDLKQMAWLDTSYYHNYSPAVTYSCIQDAVPGDGNIPLGGAVAHNIDRDPIFANPLGPDGTAGTLDDNLRLSSGSPCLDVGNMTSGAITGTDGPVYAAAVLNGKVYAGGSFATVGGVSASNIACWDPITRTWSVMGAGPGYVVRALAALNGKLYVGGDSGIKSWDPTVQTWFTLGSSVGASAVYALSILNGKVYVGGNFSTAGGITVNNIACWNPDTSAWSALGSGRTSTVYALAAIGNDLYVGGYFTGVIARWDSNLSTWNSLGSGANSYVLALTSLNGKLYAGGYFSSAGGVSNARYIACWDPSASAWSALGSGMDSYVYALTALDGKLYAGGNFYTAGGVDTGSTASWNPTTLSWSALGSGPNSSVNALTSLNGILYAGGSFSTAGGRTAGNIAAWDGAVWQAPGLPADLDDLNGNADTAEALPCDLDNGPRVVSSTVDLGTYEYADCNLNGTDDGADIAAGTAQDCNQNGIPDSCDIAANGSLDGNSNGTIDTCEAPQVDVSIVPVVRKTDPTGTPDTTDTLPTSLTTLARQTQYYVEIWASDVGSVNTGLTSVYVTINFSGSTTAVAINHGSTFKVFPSGTIGSTFVNDFGGSKVPNGGGVTPEWVRLGWISMIADTPTENCVISLSASGNGVGVYNRSPVSWVNVDLGSTTLGITLQGEIYDLYPSGFVDGGDLGLFAGFWSQSVSPGTQADFDGSGVVDAGDLSYFATAWQKWTDDPTIAPPGSSPVPPPVILTAQVAPNEALSTSSTDVPELVSPQVAIRMAVLNASFASDTAQVVPTSVAQLLPGHNYTLEVWASDVSDTPTGLTSVYTDITISSAVVSVGGVGYGGTDAFQFFQSGDVVSGGISNLGGSALPGTSGISPEWVRVATAQLAMNGIPPSSVTFAPTVGKSGVAAYGRGMISASQVDAQALTLGYTPADFDQDGDVDAADFTILDECDSGPRVPQVPACSDKDLDDDGDVDQDDFGIFQQCYSGEGKPADPACAN